MCLAQEIRDHRVPSGSFSIWWLGQSGVVLKTPGGVMAVFDPYLSNSCREIGLQAGVDMDRLVPPPLAPADLVGMDLYAITHSHGDHLDPATLAGYCAAGGQGPFLAPPETAEKLEQMGVPASQIVMTWPNKAYTIGDLTVRATMAIPLDADDLTHVGYLAQIKDGPTLYTTGDTGYDEVLVRAARPHRPDVLLTVINAAFRNLSPAEAARLARLLDVKIAIPCHYDLFPGNSLPPQLFRTCLMVEGIAERYRRLEHGRCYTYPEA